MINYHLSRKKILNFQFLYIEFKIFFVKCFAKIDFVEFFEISPNPRDYEVEKGALIYQGNQCDLILAIGGGSVMDCAKGVGIVISNKKAISNFEGVDKIQFPIPPMICIPTTGGSSAYVTYHNYFAGQPLNQVACSDGRYGLTTRWGYSTIDPMAPYVMATSVSGWNSPNCGKCYRVSGPAGTRYITAIDQCAPGPGGIMLGGKRPSVLS